MYITINDVIGEKMIDLSYPIHSLNTRKEITVIRMISDNVQYEMKEPIKLKLMGGGEKRVAKGTYSIRELNTLVERKFIITNLGNNLRVIKTDKLESVTEMILNLGELDNTNNLEDGRPSNALFT